MRPPPFAWILAGVLSLASGARVAPAAAQPSGARAPAAPTSPGREANLSKAREHFQQGQRLFKVSRYREAMEQFKEAFVAVEDPVFLYNIAQCHRLLGENAEAVRFYRRYLEEASTPSERARAKRWIAELEATAPATSPGGLTPPPLGSTSSSPKPSQAPASGAVAPVIKPAPVEAAPTASVTFTSPPTDPPADRPIYSRWWFWAGVGAVVVVGVVAASAAASNRPLTCGSGFARCEQL